MRCDGGIARGAVDCCPGCPDISSRRCVTGGTGTGGAGGGAGTAPSRCDIGGGGGGGADERIAAGGGGGGGGSATPFNPRRVFLPAGSTFGIASAFALAPLSVGLSSMMSASIVEFTLDALLASLSKTCVSSFA